MWKRKRGDGDRQQAVTPPAVSPNQALIGRVGELARLQSLVTRSAQGHLMELLIEGVPGIGKGALVDALRAWANRELPGPRFVEVYCYQETGSQDPFGPLAEALQLLVSEEKRDFAKDVVSIVREFGPDLLEFVPVLGSTLSKAAKIGGGIAGRLLAREDSEIQARWENIPFQFERTLAAVASQRGPLVLVVREAQWIDRSSTEVLLRLIRHSSQCPMAVILTATPLAEDHPLNQVQREAAGAIEHIELDPLSEEEIGTYLRARYGPQVARELAPWLSVRSEGKQLHAAEYLTLLEQEGAIQLTERGAVLARDLGVAEQRLPGDVSEVLRQRVGRVEQQDRQMLQLASVHGQQFLSATLAELLAEKELDVVVRLEEIERQQGLVRFTSVERWGARRSALYSFESGIQPILYESISRYRRLVLHREIAESIERFIGGDEKEGEVQPPRKWVLQIARHYAEAEEPLLSGQRYLLAAHSAFGDGGFRETVGVCREALGLVRNLPEGVEENDRVRAEIIELLVDASENSWERQAESVGDTPLLELVEEAEQAASRAQDHGLLAQLEFAKGKIALRTGSLDEAIGLFQGARSLAERAGDALTQLIIMSELGHHLDSKDLRAGRDVLRAAFDLYRAGRIVPADAFQEKLLARHQSRLKTFLGVASFDLGQYGEAETWLTEGIDELREEGDPMALSWALSFIGQLFIATGRYEVARSSLQEAIDLSGGDSVAVSYLLALLGKLYLEQGAVADAADPLREAWTRIPASELHHAIAPLVRNAYAEFLLARNSGGDLDEARALLLDTVQEADRIGFQRTLISALSLLGRLHHERGQVAEAMTYSGQAIDRLRDKKWFTPTVRTEEILFVHHAILSTAGREEAADYVRHAASVLQEKAESIPNPEAKKTFLERVPLSQEILQAMKANTPV